MFILPSITFSKLMKNPKNANIARKIYTRKNFDLLSIEEINNSEFIEARGEFSYYDEFYSARVEVHKSTNEVTYLTCNCPWCTHSIPCAHIGSLILTLQETQMTELPLTYENPHDFQAFEAPEFSFSIEDVAKSRQLAASKNLISTLQELHSDTIHISTTEKLSLTPVFTIYSTYREPHFTLDFRIGTTKTYVVKDMLALLRQIDNQEFVTFGKHLSCQLTMDAFDSDSQAMLQFLYRIFHPSMLHPSAGSIRYVAICSSNIDDFFETFLSFENLVDIFLEDIDDKLTLDFQARNHGYIYSLTTKTFATTKQAYYRVDCDTLLVTRYMYKQPKLVNKFLDIYRSSFDTFVSFEDMNYFYQFLLKDLADDIELINFPFSNIEKNEIVDIELYGDISNTSEVEFALHFIHNDGTKSYGFSNGPLPVNKDCLVLTSFFTKYASHIDTDNYKAYFSLDDEKTYDFIHNGLESLKEYCTIFISENLKKIGVSKKYSISVGVHLESNLLEFDFSTTDFPIEELRDILKNYRRNKKFFRLKNGELLHLESNDLKDLDDLMHDNHFNIDQINDGKLKTSAHRAFAIEDSFSKSSNLLIDRQESFKSCLNNFKTSTVKFQVKAHYKDILREYQTVGIEWLGLLQHYNFNGILADDMGLGKTLQVIAFLDSCNSTLPSLVICPSSLILNWESEIKKFSPHLKCIAIHGSQASRLDAIGEITNYDICVTSYDYLRRDIEQYIQQQFNYVILDEAQYIKNQNTKNAQCVKMLISNHRLALTGTPIENSLAELWSLFDFLMPDYLFNYHYFKKNFETPIAKQNDIPTQNKLKKLVEPFILRRLKTTVLKELPEKIEQTLTIDFSEEEEKVYLAHALQIAKNLKQQINLGSVDKIQILAMLIKLRQLCIEPRLLFDNFTTPSSKMEACMNIIQSFKENKKKILLFSSFPSVFNYFIDEFKKSEIKYHIISGKTDKVDRHTYVDAFQHDDSTVFLISLKAGGTGLNLTSAEGVIHFDPWWNVSAQNQATDRSHRIGQKNIVQVYKLIMKNSIEEKIMNLQALKKNLADTFIEDSEGSIGSLSNEQLLDLFNIN